jgi:hypothetical protein
VERRRTGGAQPSMPPASSAVCVAPVRHQVLGAGSEASRNTIEAYIIKATAGFEPAPSLSAPPRLQPLGPSDTGCSIQAELRLFAFLQLGLLGKGL